ncbi:hypothetical protein LZ198_03045 [Myxococcus sp. K15C18031901]|uniref:hypothetical protein n=1 Tax=Myxococcus dinghuensis TaxID=2906761 RepID=UPI0020A76CA7|nr:hypothetical protein [Myxococcus dinghuensis]MCP3097847.1 hypothetical protein [Myxococcus dinghuensis]
MTSPEPRPTTPLWFGLLPLPAILLGAFVAWRSDVPVTAFATNAMATVLGAGVAALVGRLSGTALQRAALPIAVTAVLLTASTLVFPGLDGVHRWIQVGPVRLLASAIAVPWVLLGMSVARPQRFASSVALALGLAAVHAAQPDAGQGTAFALAASVLFVRARSGPWLPRALACAGVLALGFAAWLRPDPLDAVPHVERIVQLATRLDPVLGVVAVVTLVLLLVPAALGATRARTGGGDDGGFSISLLAYLAATLGVTALGNFPVPAMGAGAGPLLGWYAATGILVATLRRRGNPSGAAL